PGKTEGNRSEERPRLDRGAALWRNAYLFRHVGSRMQCASVTPLHKTSFAGRAQARAKSLGGLPTSRFDAYAGPDRRCGRLQGGADDRWLVLAKDSLVLLL